jgi:hypothetical protein
MLSHIGKDGVYMGIGFTGGAYVSYFLDRAFAIRAEAAYASHNGSLDTESLSFGLVDLGLQGEYVISNFLLFGGIRYDLGAGIGNIPRTVPITSAIDLNSPWAEGGVGWRFKAGDVNTMAIRLKYGASFVRAPVAFQATTLLFYFGFQG